MKLARAAERRRPDDPRIAVLEGIAYRSLGQTPAALKEFNRAIVLAPNYLPALEGAAEVEYQSGSRRAFSLLKRIETLVPADPTVHAMLAVLEYQRHQCGAAVADFRAGWAAAQRQTRAMQEYGACLVRLHHAAEAVPVFQKLVESGAGNNQWSRYNLAVVESMAGEDKAALETLRPVVETVSPPSRMLSLAAQLEEALGRTPKAVEYLRRAILADPKDTRNYLQFAMLSFDHASFQAGIAMIDAGLKESPRSSDLYLARGILYVQMGKYAKGEADFETANRLNPHQAFGSVGQGLAEFESGRLGRALKSVRAELKRRPRDAYLHYLQAEILVQKGVAPGSVRQREATAALQEALRLQPGFGGARDLLADLDLHSGNARGAIRESRLALRSDPNDLTALYHLVLAYRQAGQRDQIPALLKRLAAARNAVRSQRLKYRRYRLFIEKPQGGNAGAR